MPTLLSICTLVLLAYYVFPSGDIVHKIGLGSILPKRNLHSNCLPLNQCANEKGVGEYFLCVAVNSARAVVWLWGLESVVKIYWWFCGDTWLWFPSGNGELYSAQLL